VKRKAKPKCRPNHTVLTSHTFLPFSFNGGGGGAVDEFVIDIPRLEQSKPKAP